MAFHVILYWISLKGLRIWDRNSFRLRPSRAFNSNFGIPAKLLKKEVLLSKDFSYKVNLNIIWNPVRKNYVLALDKQAILFIFAVMVWSRLFCKQLSLYYTLLKKWWVIEEGNKMTLWGTFRSLHIRLA